jgi:hypothetical protein
MTRGRGEEEGIIVRTIDVTLSRLLPGRKKGPK